MWCLRSAVYDNLAHKDTVNTFGVDLMQEERKQLIKAIAKDALELELEDFCNDKVGYLQDNEVDIDDNLLSDSIILKEPDINDEAINILTKRLCQLTADLSDDEAVEFISDGLRSRKVIKDTFKELF